MGAQLISKTREKFYQRLNIRSSTILRGLRAHLASPSIGKVMTCP